MDNTHRIVRVNGHYEAYDSKGKFITSGDTYKECEDDLIEIIVEEAKKNNRKQVVA